MKIESKQEILELLEMPYDRFSESVAVEAKELYRKRRKDELVYNAMLGFSNVCRCRCLYCGMRAGQKIPRYSIPVEDVLATAKRAKEMGFSRMFLISGENPGYGYENLLKIFSGIKEMGLHLSVACGEFSPLQYREFAEAGVDEYVLKFEISDEMTFNLMNPSTNFAKRMRCIEAVKESGMALASGNIVDFPGHTLEQIADDILLMKNLGISWAPVIPYLPAKGTPLAEDAKRGDILLNLREISILRLMMPDIDITAQQPGRNPADGLGGEEGNLMALNAGANMLFADFLPDTLEKRFSVVDTRALSGLEHIRRMASLSGMSLADRQ